MTAPTVEERIPYDAAWIDRRLEVEGHQAAMLRYTPGRPAAGKGKKARPERPPTVTVTGGLVLCPVGDPRFFDLLAVEAKRAAAWLRGAYEPAEPLDGQSSRFDPGAGQ